MDSELSDINGSDDVVDVDGDEGSADEYTLQEAQEDDLCANGDEEYPDYHYNEAEDEVPHSKRSVGLKRNRVTFDYAENDEDDDDDDFEDDYVDQVEDHDVLDDHDVIDSHKQPSSAVRGVHGEDELRKKKKVSSIGFAEEDVAKKKPSVHSKMVLDLIQEGARSRRGNNLTEEEQQLRRAENSRKRRNLSEKKLEEEKQDTINRLLKRRAGKSRSNLNVHQEKTPNEDKDSIFVKQRRPYNTDGLIRIVYNSQRTIMALDPFECD